MCDLKFIRTEMRRTTVAQEIQKILGPCEGNLHRKVQVIIPQSPQVFVDLDLTEGDTGNVMTNKVFNMPVMHPGQFLEFPMGCTQQLYAASSEGFALVTLVIEYYSDGAP